MLAGSCIAVRNFIVTFHVLKGIDGLYLIDAGFIGGLKALRLALRKRGWDGLPIRGIILTHGHLDHTLNVAALAERAGAWVAAPRLDEAHIAGTHRYGGWSLVCGLAERFGRALLGYRVPHVDHWFDDGDVLPGPLGLRAVHLPGHTVGHCGLHWPEQQVLFAGDLCSCWLAAAWPPRMLNDSSAIMLDSLKKALAMDLQGVVLNHSCGQRPRSVLLKMRALLLKMYAN
jgi:glyoxylase-like metal-dependent hydrolase (beta-lactamase superfamily II)